MVFTSKYGVVGLAVVQKEFIAEGINEAGLSAGLFFFPQYGGYEQYDPAQSDRTLADLQLVAWILTQFSTIDQVKAAIASVRVVGLEPSSVVHWRIGEPSGRQVVLEIVGGVPHFYENEVGVLTNAPGFEWQLTNLNNYVNLYPGDAPARRLSGITLRPIGGNSGFLGLSGDATPPSRFVRAAFIGRRLRSVLPDSKPCSNVFTCSTISMCPSASSIPKGSVRTSRALRSGLRPSI